MNTLRTLTTLAAAALLSSTIFTLAPEATAQPAPSASADDAAGNDQKAQQLFKLGNQRYEEGAYFEAIEAFEESYRLSGRHELLYNLANANERMGNLRAAIRHLNTYVPHATEPEKKKLQRRIDNLSKRLNGNPSPEPTPPSPQPPAPVDTQPNPPTPISPAPVADDAEEGDSGNVLVPVGGVLLGIGGVGVIAGAILGGVANSSLSDAEAGCSNGFCTAEAADAADTHRGLAVGADISFIIGGAALVAGTIVLIAGLSGDDDGADKATTWFIAPTGGSSAAGLVAGGRF